MAAACVPPDVEAFLAEARLVRVATVGRSGTPAVAPFWFTWDGLRVFLGTEENATVRNLRRTGRATVLVDFGVGVSDVRGALLHGEARAYPHDAAPPALAPAAEAWTRKYAAELADPLFREIVGERPDATVYVEILPGRVRWWDHGRRIF
jgi:hypothetical protein